MIVFPMAGLSRRFSEAGYSVPKYMLEAHGRSLFSHAVASFSAYFSDIPFLFIARDVHGTADFVRRETDKLGISEVRVAIIDAPTSGQAETVELGIRRSSVPAGEPVTIFNIDTFRPSFSFPTEFNHNSVDGYLEVFRGEGVNWSYVRSSGLSGNRVAETTEKVPISDLCCTGVYHFGSAGLYLDAYDRFKNGLAKKMGLTELYVAPMYNLLLHDGRDIRYHLIEAAEVVFCGVPAEYTAFLQRRP